MNIKQKLNEVQRELSDNQIEEREIIETLMFLMFGRESNELPKKFKVECMMDNDGVETFLREKVGLDVKEVSLVPGSIIFGGPVFEVELN